MWKNLDPSFITAEILWRNLTAHKIRFSIKDSFNKCDQIRRKLRIWSYLLKKYLTENFIFCAVSEEEWQNILTNKVIGHAVFLNVFIHGFENICRFLESKFELLQMLWGCIFCKSWTLARRSKFWYYITRKQEC